MVNDAQQMLLLVGYKHGMNKILVHYLLYLSYFGICENALRRACHYLFHGVVDEVCLPTFHSAAYIAVGYQSYNLLVLVKRHAKSQLSLAHQYDGLAKMHLFGDDGKVVCARLRGHASFSTFTLICTVLYFASRLFSLPLIPIIGMCM